MPVVLVPWRDEPGRRPALEWTRNRWREAHPDWDHRLAPAPDGPWCKAAAIMDAAPSDGVVVIADADVWCEQVADAVAAVEAGDRWAVPHRKVWRLTERGTQAVLGGADPTGQPLEHPAYTGMPGGGIVVIRADVLAEVPFDRRFVGWGREDCAWRDAMLTIVGKPWRGVSKLVHLWHPPQADLGHERVFSRSPASEALYARYAAARRKPDQMRALLVGADQPTQRRSTACTCTAT